MVNKIVHLADIHIRKSLRRHEEYRSVLDRTLVSIKEQNPDRIVLVGDIYHDFIDIEGEALVIATQFLKGLSNICKVIITRGNHDFMKKNKNRYDVIQTITEMIKDSNILYLNETGFYPDDNITWAVWHHPDKQGPWKTIDHNRESKQTYIDLFHDPVKSCMTPLGWPLEKGVHITVEDFEGDLGMFGDIHLQQDMDGDGKKAYCGSLIQQSFDEKIHGHGYLSWDIEKEQYSLIEVENDWRHIEIVLDGDIDYDNLDITLKETFKHMYFKVKWTDTRNNIHRINQSKIREFLKKYDPLDIKWDKNILKNSEMEVDEELRKNINDPEVQRKVFQEYLKEIGYSEETIDHVLNIDEIVSGRLPNKESILSDYQIEALWLNNFKSYGDDNLIDWQDNNGIIQITGENQVGKTTILDGICYTIFGKTLSTTKKQKHGDNRFINNKRDLNHCSGWVVLRINEKRFLLKRATGRKMHKVENRVTSVTTEFYIYDLIDLNIEDITVEVIDNLDVNDAITGERFLDTQKEIEKSVGTFEDFIRVVMINADNLNDLLSINRADFIDAVMRYAGYTIFEDKLEEFKDYKKEVSKRTEKIVLNLNDENDNLKKLEKEVLSLKDINKNSEESIKTEKETKLEHEKVKESLLRDIINVSDDIKDFDPEESETAINEVNTKIKAKELLIEETILKVENLSSDKEIEEAYNDIKFNTLKKDNKRKEKDDLKEALNTFKSNKQKINSKLVLEKQNKDSKISTLKGEFTHKISECTIKIDSYINESQYIITDAKKLNIEIKDLESSKECSTCGQTLKDDAIDKIKESIVLKKKELLLLKDKNTKKISDIEYLKEEISKIELGLSNINEHESVIKIENDYKLIVSSIDKDVKEVDVEIDDQNTLISNLDKDIINYTESIDKLKLITEDDSKKKDLNHSINTNKLKIEEYKIDIKNHKANMQLYEANQKSIEHNKKITASINNETAIILKLDNDINTLNRELNQSINSLARTETDIKTLKNRIEKYSEQVKLEEVYKIYQKCVHRDGIPTMLLKRSVDVINDEMSTLLKDQDYMCFFDGELNLMMSSLSKLSSNQHAIESSGKERTFIALALKLALRAINNTSRPNIILLDEMTGKLINESVEQFIVMLNRIKESIDKIIIIEHNHNINYDWRINVSKDDKGVSNCELLK